jgi:putative phage-type endonuclease
MSLQALETPTNGSLIRLHKTLDMPREQWLELRRRGIGGSDSPTVVGLNPWSSRLELYADKLGLIEEREDNEAMRQGRDLEDYVAKRWEEATGKKVRRENHILYNPLYEFAFANIDRAVVGEKALLEVKTTSVYNKHDFENGEIPDYYYCQVTHYLGVTGYEKAYLAVLVLNKGFYHYEIYRNQAEIDALMEAERLFWVNHVQKRVPPEPDGSDSAYAVLSAMDRGSSTTYLSDTLLADYDRAKKTAKEYADEAERLKQLVIQALGSNERGEGRDYKCSYLEQTRESIDTKKLKSYYPDIYNQFKKESTYRVLRMNEKKGDKQ